MSVAVRPETTEIIGLSGPVEDGTVVGLTCRTRGARPAAWITWYNGSAPFAETPTDDVALRVSERIEELWLISGEKLIIKEIRLFRPKFRDRPCL